MFEDVTDEELDALMHLGGATDLTSECEDLMKGIDIREYAESVTAQLNTAEDGLSEQYVDNADAAVGVWVDMEKCLGELDLLEVELGGFKKGMEAATEEIQTVQDAVGSLQVKSDNRKIVGKELDEMLEKILLPPDSVLDLQNTEVSPRYVHHLRQLTTAASLCKSRPKLEISREVRPCVDTLTMLLSSKLRGFLLEKIGTLSKPKTNISIIQSNVLLRYKDLVSYLLTNNGVVGQEIKDTYVHTMGQIYSKKTKQFYSKLMKLEKTLLTVKDTLSTGKTDALDPSISTAVSPGRVFSFIVRGNVMDNWNAPVLVPHIEEEKRRLHPYEAVFRSQHLMLIDIITSEYIFTFDFFSDKSLYIPIFQETVTYFKTVTIGHIKTLHDPMTLLTCIRLTMNFISVMEKRSIPCLHGYHQSLLVSLWNQLLTVVKNYLTAISATVRVPKIGGEYGRLLPVVDKAAHLIGNIYRYLVKCSVPNEVAVVYKDQLTMLLAQVSGVCVEVKRLVTMRQESERGGLLFTTVNFSHIVCVWIDVYEVDAEWEELKKMEGWLMQSKTALTQKLINHHFPGFVKVIVDAEQGLRSPLGGDVQPSHDTGVVPHGGLVSTEHEKRRTQIDADSVLQAAERFGRSWSESLPRACKEVISGNPQHLAHDLATRLVMQLAIYSERLKKILTRCWLSPPCGQWLVPNQALLNTVNALLKVQG